VPAEGAGPETFFHADYFPAVQAVGRGGEERVSRGHAVAGAGGGGGAGGVGLLFECADCGVLSGMLVEEPRGRVWGKRGERNTRSWRVVDAPCMGAPPATVTFVFGAGEAVREGVRAPVRTLGRSDIRGPDAEGGGLEDGRVGLGDCLASGFSDRARVLDNPGCCCWPGRRLDM